MKNSSCISNINYHLVFCPKYRKKILIGEIKKFLESCFSIIAETKQWTIIEMRIMPDHIHLFLSCPPTESPMAIIKILKGTSGLQLFKQFPNLKEKMWSGHIWSSGYYVGTAGNVSAKTIERYIREQGNSSTD